MKLRFEVDQADSFRRGIERPKSIVSIDVNPADVPEKDRNLIADRLEGIDVLEQFFYDGEIIKGFRIKELSRLKIEPQRIVANGVTLEALMQAVKINENQIAAIRRSFIHPVQFSML